MSFYNLLITITWVDFRSDWALCCCCRCTFAQETSASLQGLGATDVFCAKAKRQQQDVGHEGVITGRDGFSLRSSIADPRGVAQSPLQSTYSHGIRFSKMSSTFGDKLKLTLLRF